MTAETFDAQNSVWFWQGLPPILQAYQLALTRERSGDDWPIILDDIRANLRYFGFSLAWLPDDISSEAIMDQIASNRTLLDFDFS